jgi:hypothetical protein
VSPGRPAAGSVFEAREGALGQDALGAKAHEGRASEAEAE